MRQRMLALMCGYTSLSIPIDYLMLAGSKS